MTELVLRQASIAWRTVRSVDGVWILVALIPVLVAVLDPDGLTDFVTFAVGALLNTLPYITLAVLLIGGLKATGAEGIAAAAFQGRETRMIVMAALVGGLAPFCSCEVIPFIAALLAAGAPLSAVMAFWLSSPLMDPPQFFITIEALGVEYAVSKVIAAVAIGLLGGFTMKMLMARGAFANPLRADFAKAGGCCSATTGCGAPKTEPEAPVWRFWQEPERIGKFRDAALENALFLLKWMSLAYLLESTLVHYVPADFIGSIVGGEGVLPIIVGALVGAPAYLNGYAAPALVDGLMEQGMSPGAAMSFMIAGAVSSIPAMAAVFALVRRPVFGMYVALGIGGAIASGLLFSAILPML
ncbi:MAG: permease [Pseudomonadota bacterium]